MTIEEFNIESVELAFKEAAAQAMGRDVRLGDITIVCVVEGNTDTERRKVLAVGQTDTKSDVSSREQKLGHHVWSRLESFIIVEYDVIFSTPNPAAAMRASLRVQANLAEAVANGQFTSLLQDAGEEEGTTAFDGIDAAAEDVTLTTIFPIVPTAQPTEGSGSASMDVLINVVAAVGGAMCLLASLFLCAAYRKNKPKKKVNVKQVVPDNTRGQDVDSHVIDIPMESTTLALEALPKSYPIVKDNSIVNEHSNQTRQFLGDSLGLNLFNAGDNRDRATLRPTSQHDDSKIKKQWDNAQESRTSWNRQSARDIDGSESEYGGYSGLVSPRTERGWQPVPIGNMQSQYSVSSGPLSPGRIHAITSQRSDFSASRRNVADVWQVAGPIPQSADSNVSAANAKTAAQIRSTDSGNSIMSGAVTPRDEKGNRVVVPSKGRHERRMQPRENNM
jgi:hypothetical protein